MKQYDVLIVGGGMVGLSLALAIRKLTKLTIAIADTNEVTSLDDEPELRVSAINAASAALFEQLDVWQTMLQTRAQPYKHMHVWDSAGYGKLDLGEDLTHAAQLGHIIENKVIRNALWSKAQADDGIDFYTQEPISNIGFGELEAFASFQTQMPITAKLVVGADGANSWLRKQLGTKLTHRDYDHHAIVATVETSSGHQDTAWQVFLETGPLALLPLNSVNSNGKLASIVWSTTPEEAVRIQNLSGEEFSKEISAATEGKLGVVKLSSNTASFPLTMRLAGQFTDKNTVLIGDAAHTIHPLAGQGVNLGLKDAAALADSLADMCTHVSDKLSLDPIKLNSFERWRKNDAIEMISAMEAIKQAFTPQQKPIQLIRGLGMQLINAAAPIKKGLVTHATGRVGELPSLMNY